MEDALNSLKFRLKLSNNTYFKRLFEVPVKTEIREALVINYLMSNCHLCRSRTAAYHKAFKDSLRKFPSFSEAIFPSGGGCFIERDKMSRISDGTLTYFP